MNKSLARLIEVTCLILTVYAVGIILVMCSDISPSAVIDDSVHINTLNQ